MINEIFNLKDNSIMKTKNVFILVFLFLFVLGLSSCIKDNNDEKEKTEIVTMHISSETKLMKFLDEALIECMIVTVLKEEFYLPLGCISGFEYEKGYEYRLKVKKTTPAHPLQDDLSDFYSLIEILSKEKKENY